MAKSKFGCTTCKIRRVKCGEEKPYCCRCTSTGRQCEYRSTPSRDFRYLSDVAPWSPALPFSRNLSIFSSTHEEIRAFEFFFERIIPVFSGGLNAAFWSRSVVQACRSEPLVWDAVISISALSEFPQISSDLIVRPEQRPKSPVSDPHHKQALLWYDRSLSRLSSQLSKGSASNSIALLSCVLYISIELLQDNMTEAVALYHRGVELLSNLDPLTLEGSIVPIFWNFSALAIITGLVKPGTEIIPRFNGLDFSCTLSTSEAALYSIVAACMALHHAARADNPPAMAVLQAEQQSLQNRLSQWLENHRALHISMEDSSPRDQRYTSIKLLQAHANVSILLATCLDPSEMGYDACFDKFEQIVSYGRIGIAATKYPDDTQPTFLLEHSIALPLYVAASKCRNHQLRHEALSLLRQAPAVQGLVKSAPYAKIAAKLIELEEGRYISASATNKLLLERGEPLPEQYRVRDHLFTPHFDSEGRMEQFINCTRRQQDERGTWQTVEELVPL